jgi:hypothetical protein
MSEFNQPNVGAATDAEISFTWWEVYGVINITLGNGFLAFGIDLPAPAKAIALVVNTAISIGILQKNKIAFLAATVLSFNPLIWLINGVYLNNRWSHPSVNSGIKKASHGSGIQQKWWQADQKFRLTALVCVLWMIGAIFTQESYRIDLREIFLPPALLLVGYFGYKRFVIAPEQINNSEAQQLNKQPNRQPSGSEHTEETKIKINEKTPAERNKSLDELIEMMKNK